MFSRRVLKVTAQPFVQNEDPEAESGNGERAGEKPTPRVSAGRPRLVRSLGALFRVSYICVTSSKICFIYFPHGLSHASQSFTVRLATRSSPRL